MSTPQPPDPLVGPDVDLRDYPYMPVDIGRLFGSEFHAVSDDAAWRAGVTLWLKSYHQVPAASLPNDDISLARLAEFGRDVKSWRKVRNSALRGWILCSDGRLYHPVVAEKALEAWIEKIIQRRTSAAGNARRYHQTFSPKPFDDEIERSRRLLERLNPKSRLLSRTAGKYASESGDVVPARTPNGSPSSSPDGAPNGSADGSPDGTPPDLLDRSQGKEREGKGRENIHSTELIDSFARWFEIYPRPVDHDLALRRFCEIVEAGDATVEDLIDGARRYRRDTEGTQLRWIKTPMSWFEGGCWKDGRREAAAHPPDQVFVAITDPISGMLRERFKRERHKTAPTMDGGWYFPIAWVEEARGGLGVRETADVAPQEREEPSAARSATSR